jgi:hypothetical protein
MSRTLFMLAAALLAAGTGLAEEEPVIYRCEGEGIIEFSDRPCQDDSGTVDSAAQQIHHSQGSVSVISPPADLEAIQEASRSWLEDHRDRQSQERQAAQEARIALRNAAPAHVRAYDGAAEPRRIVPVLWPYRPHAIPYRRHPALGPTPVNPRQRPYSALSGPFPGTVRSDLEPAVPPNR